MVEQFEKGLKVSVPPETSSFREKVCHLKTRRSMGQVHLIWLLCKAIAAQLMDFDMAVEPLGAIFYLIKSLDMYTTE